MPKKIVMVEIMTGRLIYVKSFNIDTDLSDEYIYKKIRPVLDRIRARTRVTIF